MGPVIDDPVLAVEGEEEQPVNNDLIVPDRIVQTKETVMSKHQGPDELSEALALEKKRRSEERLLK